MSLIVHIYFSFSGMTMAKLAFSFTLASSVCQALPQSGSGATGNARNTSNKAYSTSSRTTTRRTLPTRTSAASSSKKTLAKRVTKYYALIPWSQVCSV